MAYELFYTSAARGLRPGTGGFCTVAHTAGMAAPLVRSLEAASAYQGGGSTATRDPERGSPGAGGTPLVTHWRLTTAGAVYNVLSCVRPAGLDHTRRPNKLAHHVVLAPRERPAAGPAWAINRAGLLTATWNGQPRLLPAGDCELTGEDTPPGPCVSWERMAGDAGWAGVVAEALATPDRLPVGVVVPQGLDTLALAAEVIALLPHERRWDVTFSTGFVPGAGTASNDCALRFIPTDPGASRIATRNGVLGCALVLDFTKPSATPAPGAAAEDARRGAILCIAGRRAAAAGAGEC